MNICDFSEKVDAFLFSVCMMGVISKLCDLDYLAGVIMYLPWRLVHIAIVLPSQMYLFGVIQ